LLGEAESSKQRTGLLVGGPVGRGQHRRGGRPQDVLGGACPQPGQQQGAYSAAARVGMDPGEAADLGVADRPHVPEADHVIGGVGDQQRVVPRVGSGGGQPVGDLVRLGRPVQVAAAAGVEHPGQHRDVRVGGRSRVECGQSWGGGHAFLHGVPERPPCGSQACRRSAPRTTAEGHARRVGRDVLQPEHGSPPSAVDARTVVTARAFAPPIWRQQSDQTVIGRCVQRQQSKYSVSVLAQADPPRLHPRPSPTAGR
jgi:hypothetical protein